MKEDKKETIYVIELIAICISRAGAEFDKKTTPAIQRAFDFLEAAASLSSNYHAKLVSGASPILSARASKVLLELESEGSALQ